MLHEWRGVRRSLRFFLGNVQAAYKVGLTLSSAADTFPLLICQELTATSCIHCVGPTAS
jgi:hypothetical protein